MQSYKLLSPCNEVIEFAEVCNYVFVQPYDNSIFTNVPHFRRIADFLFHIYMMSRSSLCLKILRFVAKVIVSLQTGNRGLGSS